MQRQEGARAPAEQFDPIRYEESSRHRSASRTHIRALLADFQPRDFVVEQIDIGESGGIERITIEDLDDRG